MSTTKTGIEWTQRTWNPVRGCTRISEGCRNCYAERVAARFSDPGGPFHLFADRSKSGSKWTGKVELIESQLNLPLRWRKPQRVFVNSMSDLFHESLADQAIDDVFRVMAKCPHITFQILTKRAERLARYPWRHWRPTHGEKSICFAVLRGEQRGSDLAYLPNVWLGVSVEDLKATDGRLPWLRRTPAAVRFISYEPALGPIATALQPFLSPAHLPGRHVKLGPLNEWIVDVDDAHTMWRGIDWVIAGAESGPGARPMDEQWVRDVKNQCVAAHVPFFYKQNVGKGKKISTPELDGRTWTQFPEVRA